MSAGGRLEGGWREVGERLEGGWTEVGCFSEHPLREAPMYYNPNIMSPPPIPIFMTEVLGFGDML